MQPNAPKESTGTALLAVMSGMLLVLIMAHANEAHAAQPICTNVATSFSPSSPISAGTTANVIGTVKQAGAVNGCSGGTVGTPVTVGTTTEKENEVGGVGAPCGHGICAGVGGPSGRQRLLELFRVQSDAGRALRQGHPDGDWVGNT